MVDRPTEVHQPNSKMEVDEVVNDANDDDEDRESEYDLADMWDNPVACKKAECERALKMCQNKQVGAGFVCVHQCSSPRSGLCTQVPQTCSWKTTLAVDCWHHGLDFVFGC